VIALLSFNWSPCRLGPERFFFLWRLDKPRWPSGHRCRRRWNNSTSPAICSAPRGPAISRPACAVATRTAGRGLVVPPSTGRTRLSCHGPDRGRSASRLWTYVFDVLWGFQIRWKRITPSSNARQHLAPPANGAKAFRCACGRRRHCPPRRAGRNEVAPKPFLGKTET